MNAVEYTVVTSPWGNYLVASTEEGICAVDRVEDLGVAVQELEARWRRPLVRADEALREARRQLGDYFHGKLQTFSLPVHPIEGTPFEQRVWSSLMTIPYGEVRSYGWVAEKIGKPGAARAVGGANGRNPVAVMVPCHRVVNADGSLGGYTGGLWVKERLLGLEGAMPRPRQRRPAKKPTRRSARTTRVMAPKTRSR